MFFFETYVARTEEHFYWSTYNNQYICFKGHPSSVVVSASNTIWNTSISERSMKPRHDFGTHPLHYHKTPFCHQLYTCRSISFLAPFRTTATINFRYISENHYMILERAYKTMKLKIIPLLHYAPSVHRKNIPNCRRNFLILLKGLKW